MTFLPMSALHRRICVVVAVSSALAMLVGCGSDSPENTGPEPRGNAAAIAAAQQQVLEAGSARFTGTVSSPELETPLRTEGMTSWQGSPMGEVSATNDKTVDLTARVTTEAAYIRRGGEFAYPTFDNSPSGADLARLFLAEWVKLPVAVLGERDAGAQTLRNALRCNSAAGSLSLLRQAEEIELVGTETKNGVDTRHFRGQIEVAGLTPDRKAGLTGTDLEPYQREYAELGVTVQQIDVWLGDDDLPVRIELLAKSPTGDVTSSADYSEFGVEVNVTPPPAEQTFDMTPLLQKPKDAEPSDGAGKFFGN